MGDMKIEIGIFLTLIDPLECNFGSPLILLLFR